MSFSMGFLVGIALYWTISRGRIYDLEDENSALRLKLKEMILSAKYRGN